MHHDVCMRSTLTLDEDIADQLAAISREEALPYKVVVNETLRRGLAGQAPALTPFEYEAHAGNLMPGIDPRRFNELAGELEEERFRR